jgi:two-component system LytT family sensor kinase
MTARSHWLAKVLWAYAWSFLIWAAFIPLLAGQDKVLSAARGINTPFWIFVIAHGPLVFATAVVTPLIFAIVHRYPLERPVKISRAAAYLLGTPVYMTTVAFIRWLVLPPWNPLTQQFDPRTLETLLNSLRYFALLSWDYVVIMVAAHGYEYFWRARKQESERAELQRALAASELQALKSQLHPHFLFNTLQGISTLIDADHLRAKNMLLNLSHLLRTALRYGSADLITLDEELKFIEGYLGLEKMRLEQRLDVRCNIELETRAMLVPQLILQPLIENAILHGVACCRGGGWIELASRQQHGSLEIIVRNSLGGIRQDGMGVGLQNTKARLKYLYLDEAAVSFEILGGKEALARLTLPAISSKTPERAAVGTNAPGRAQDEDHASTDC